MNELEKRARMDTLLREYYGKITNFLTEHNANAKRSQRVGVNSVEFVDGPRGGELWLDCGPTYTRRFLNTVRDMEAATLLPPGWKSLQVAASVSVLGPYVRITATWPQELQITHMAYPESHTHAGGLFNIGKNSRYSNVTLSLDRVSPHMLVGGATGSGKSTFVDLLIYQALQMQDWRVVLLSGKGLLHYEHWQQLANSVGPLAHTEQQIANALAWVVGEKQARQDKRKAIDKQLLVIADDVSDYVQRPGPIADSIGQLARQGRSTGIHIVEAIQRWGLDLQADKSTRGQLANYRVGFKATRKEGQLIFGSGTPDPSFLAGAGDGYAMKTADVYHRFQGYYVDPRQFDALRGTPDLTAWPEMDGEHLAGLVGNTARCYSAAEVAAILAARESGARTREDQRDILGHLDVSIGNDRLVGLRPYAEEIENNLQKFRRTLDEN